MFRTNKGKNNIFGKLSKGLQIPQPYGILKHIGLFEGRKLSFLQLLTVFFLKLLTTNAYFIIF